MANIDQTEIWTVDSLRTNIAAELLDQLDRDAVHRVVIGTGPEATTIRFADVAFDGLAHMEGPGIDQAVQGSAGDVEQWVINQIAGLAPEYSEIEYRPADGLAVDFDGVDVDVEVEA